ncbi:PP2C family serine/threonine-protein phosphatase [Nocardioides sp. R-C-SC26]|uniref:PP2C family protein-serine/threonine phosphatase n=1 Tax=Nocardioides sp. R-C-SC26 TaxID=2870414 RepID=UPI001E294C78|nr:protein phosphatase 2C domain-containing protein [Nocardioides sp. R-C-SC26]
MLQFRSAAHTHVGLVRANNEDSGFAGPYLLIVADGVGGAAAGEVASSTATYVAAALSMLGPVRGTDPLVLLGSSIDLAARQLRAGVEADPARAGMGTTLTAIATDGARCAIVQLGDSRAYLLRAGVLQQLTHDHTLVQALVDAGRISPEQARVSQHRNIVMRSLGTRQEPDPDLAWLDLEPGDRLLLCSDGLSDLVEDALIAHRLASGDCQEAVEALVGDALAAGGRDNITCVAADVVEGPPIDSRGVLVGAVVDLGHVLDPVAVR